MIYDVKISDMWLSDDKEGRCYKYKLRFEIYKGLSSD